MAQTTKEYTFSTTDVNKTPIITAQTFFVAENSDSGTTVRIVPAPDADGDKLTFSITAGNNSPRGLWSDGTV
ncbi:MAG: hypothetical protein OXH57_02510 [Ekhidna sp.]|nr:hypothetical protein [Ekhidna sp.]